VGRDATVTSDGRVDEAAWSRAPTKTGFTQRFPKDGGRASFQTRVAVLYDDDGLFVGVWAGDPEPLKIRRLLTLKIDFIPFAPVHFVSARHGTRVGDLTASMIRAYEAAMRKMPTPALTKAMEAAMMQPQPPIVRGRRIRLLYANQGGRNPPRIVVHGSQAAHVPESYKRYLANVFRERFDLFATPVAVEFRSDVNPYVGDKPKEKRGLKTAQKERRDRRIKKDRAKRPAKKKKR
jgi:GTP-binding protein